MYPDEEESFSVSYDSPKDYFFGWIGLEQSLLLSSLILLLVGKRMLRRSGLLMASIPLLEVFLLPMIGVLLEDLGFGLLGRPTLSGRGDIGCVLAGSVRTGMTGGFPWGFLDLGILFIF